MKNLFFYLEEAANPEIVGCEVRDDEILFDIVLGGDLNQAPVYPEHEAEGRVLREQVPRHPDPAGEDPEAGVGPGVVSLIAVISSLTLTPASATGMELSHSSLRLLSTGGWSWSSSWSRHHGEVWSGLAVGSNLMTEI